jgi:predicted nucleotidyltransferase
MKIAREIKPKLNKIVDYLKASGCSRIVLFGSHAEGTDYPDSDIDIAVCGIPNTEFFKAVAMLPLLVRHRVDLVDFDDLPPKFQKTIEKNGVLLYAN